MKSCLVTAALLSALPASAASLAGLWEFGNAANLGEATFGSDLLVGGTHTHHASLSDDGATALSGVVTTVGGTASFFTANHNIPANGGGTFVNQYSIVVDLFTPAGSRDSWRAIFQTNDQPAGNDADYWIAPDNNVGVGALGYSSTPLDQSSWTRLVVTIDLTSAVNTYLDGAHHFTHTAGDGVDGRFSLYPSTDLNVIHFFSDDTAAENPPMNVGAIAIFDGILTPGEVAALGGAGSVIPEPASVLSLALASLLGLRRRR